MKFKRIFVIVTDSLGVGELPDSELYGDKGVNTLKHLSYSKSNFFIPTLSKLGIGNITDVNNTPKNTHPLASYGKMGELSVGKDTLTGHLEMMGLKTEIAPKTFTENGFPKDLIEAIEFETDRHVIGNCSASGTEIIERLGVEHMKTGSLIVYTSADSVLQIAAHESIIPVKELYRICEIVRKLTLKDEWKVGRVIARPFKGKPGSFERTSNRHDYALDPFDKTVLDSLKEKKYDVLSIGKICDIFNSKGITASTRTENNLDGIKKLV